MHRRAVLSALAAAFAGAALESRANEGAPIRWSDVELIDGRVLSANDLRSSAVVAQIWASWCPFCAAQNPHVQKLYDVYKSRGLLVVAFSIDKTVQAARDYIAKRGYSFPVAMHTPQVDVWFGALRTLPETYVVERDGRIVFRHRGEMFPEDIAALAHYATK